MSELDEFFDRLGKKPKKPKKLVCSGCGGPLGITTDDIPEALPRSAKRTRNGRKILARRYYCHKCTLAGIVQLQQKEKAAKFLTDLTKRLDSDDLVD